ncbi:GNAT family N-acetyltransferase [Pseudoalteromonas ostreae]|nr:GNAT family N-acetyltransferase [Pseudoalteromonas ostreae]
MQVQEYKERNYRLLICSESDHIKIERLSPRGYVGYLQMYVKEGRLEVCDLWINKEPEDFRGKGFGSILINYAFEYAKEKCIDYIFGHTQKDDYRVHRFYERCGFEVFIDDKYGTAWFFCSLSSGLKNTPDFDQLAKLGGLSNELGLHELN